MAQALCEIEAAAAAGFKQWRHFSAARRLGMFPAPARTVPGQGPLWTQDQIDAWLGVKTPSGVEEERKAQQEEAMRRARGEPKQTPRR